MTKINFGGSIDEIKKQIEQTIATYELLGTDSTVNFEQWYEGWEKGFPDAVENRGLGNYRLAGENRWRANPENWPRWRQWSNEGGIIKGEYWRDRANETDSVPLSGTATQLINQIVQLEHQKDVQTSQQSITSDVIRYSGIPEITLFFRGRDINLSTKNQEVSGEKSFRLTGYTDNPLMAQRRKDLELITQADISRIGTKIRDIFKTTPPYVWSKGKKQVVYHDWERGYNLNVYASNHTEGEKLISAILAIREHQIDETFVKYGEAKNPGKAYPPPQEFEVIGETHKTPERLPEFNVSFSSGKIYFPTLKETKVIA